MWSYVRKSILVNTALIVLAICFVIWTAGVLREVLIVRSQYREVEDRTQKLTGQKADIEGKLAELDIPAVFEREAKSRLNLKNPGEHVVVVIPEKPAPPPPSQPAGLFNRIKAFLSAFF